MNSEIEEILNNIQEDLTFNNDEKNALEMQCKEFLDNQIKELINIKTNLIIKKVSNILNIVGEQIIKKFKLNKADIENIINKEIDSLKILDNKNSSEDISTSKVKEKIEEVEKETVKEEVEEKVEEVEEEVKEKVIKKEKKKSSSKNSKKIIEVSSIEKDNVEDNVSIINENINDEMLLKTKKEVLYCNHIKDGKRCTKKAKTNGYCGYHVPKK